MKHALKRLEDLAVVAMDNWKDNKITQLQAHFGPLVHTLRNKFSAQRVLGTLLAENASLATAPEELNNEELMYEAKSQSVCL